MLFRIVTLYLLLASSNASFLRLHGIRSVKQDEDKPRKLKTGGDTDCGGKLSTETLIAFGLDPSFSCTALADRSDIPCVTIAELNNVNPDPISTCRVSEDCTAPSNCYWLPNPAGPTGAPVANCFIDRETATEWPALQPDGEPVGETVPKEICREGIVIP